MNWFMTHPPDYPGAPYPQALGALIFIVYFITPSLSMVTAALLINENVRADAGSWWKRLPRSGLAIVLVLGLAYTIYCGSIWDSTSDGLFSVFAMQPTSLVAIGVGMIMTLALRGRQRLAGMAFLIFVPMPLYQSFEGGWRVSYQEITEKTLYADRPGAGKILYTRRILPSIVGNPDASRSFVYPTARHSGRRKVVL
jgi:hypothetical protein